MTRIQPIASLRGLRLLTVVLALAFACSVLWAQPGGGGGGGGGGGMPGGGGGGMGGGGGPDMDGGGMPGDRMDQQSSYTPTGASDLKSLTKKLKLNEDQQSQIKAILTDRDQQITALVKQAAAARTASSGSSNGSATSGAQSSNPGTMMAVFMKERTIKESANSKIEEVLTADQMKKFESWVKNQSQTEGGMGGPGGDMGGGAPGGGVPGGGGPGGGGGGGGGGGPM